MLSTLKRSWCLALLAVAAAPRLATALPAMLGPPAMQGWGLRLRQMLLQLLKLSTTRKLLLLQQQLALGWLGMVHLWKGWTGHVLRQCSASSSSSRAWQVSLAVCSTRIKPRCCLGSMICQMICQAAAHQLACRAASTCSSSMQLQRLPQLLLSSMRTRLRWQQHVACCWIKLGMAG
jgi:hypothetical protein